MRLLFIMVDSFLHAFSRTSTQDNIVLETVYSERRW